MGFAQVDKCPMDLFRLVGRRTRPAVLGLALAVLAVTLAESYAATQARLDGLIQAAHRHQEALERSELALQATRAAYAGDVRDLYARGPLAPLELVLAAGDFHELAVAAGVADGVIDRWGSPTWPTHPPQPGRRGGRPNRLGQVGKPYRWGATRPG
jgi:hypothetical protein